MPILLFINLKGGVAKTTNAVAVAECLADQGYKTLVIDADHQCMAGELLLGESTLLRCEHGRRTLHDLLGAMLEDEFDAGQIENCIIRSVSNIGGGMESLSVLPCSIRIDDFQTNMAKARKGYRTTDEFLGVLRTRKAGIHRWMSKNYDFTIIDCPPSIAMQVRFLLGVGDAFIVPSVPDRLSVRGSLWLLDRIRRSGIKIRPLGTVWSLYREQNSVHRRVVQAARDGTEPYCKMPVPFETVIPNAAAIASATEQDENPATFSSKYTPAFAKTFRMLTREIVERSRQCNGDGEDDTT